MLLSQLVECCLLLPAAVGHDPPPESRKLASTWGPQYITLRPLGNLVSLVIVRPLIDLYQQVARSREQIMFLAMPDLLPLDIKLPQMDGYAVPVLSLIHI